MFKKIACDTIRGTGASLLSYTLGAAFFKLSGANPSPSENNKDNQSQHISTSTKKN